MMSFIYLEVRKVILGRDTNKQGEEMKRIYMQFI